VRTTLTIISSLATFIFLGCQGIAVQQYKSIVNHANRFEVYFIDINKTITIPPSEIQRFKDVITKDIKPEFQRKFIIDTRIDFFRDNQRIGYLMVQNGKVPVANFNSDSLNFGFALTYRMGMWIGDMKNASSQ
jgi:hypothetical protein